MNPNLNPFNKRVIFFTPNPPCQAPWASSHHSRPKIRNTNYKHKNLRFIIFRPKIPYTNTNVKTNHKHNFHIYNFPFQNHKPNTNFRFMIFPFKITNTNPNISTITEIINTNTNLHGGTEPKKKNRALERGRERVVDWQGIGARCVRRMRGLRAVRDRRGTMRESKSWA